MGVCYYISERCIIAYIIAYLTGCGYKKNNQDLTPASNAEISTTQQYSCLSTNLRFLIVSLLEMIAKQK